MSSYIPTISLSILLLINVWMRIYNGNGKGKQFINFYQNMGRSGIAHKMHEVEYLICYLYL